jgi:purine-nucleoside phosphorylase
MVETREPPGLAIVAGSGFGALGRRLGERLRGVETVSFDAIAGVGACTVNGHRGEVRLGRLDDSGGSLLALVLGRRHVYEGGMPGMAPLMRWLSRRGLSRVVSVSAAGAVTGTIHPGELVIVTDIIDLQNRGLLQPALRDLPANAGRRAGHPAHDRAGSGGSARVSPLLTGAVEAAARRAGVGIHRGVVACGAGPAYETAAEVRALEAAGADVATMSAAAEVQYAVDLGMEIAVIAAVTNRCTGVGTDPPDHGQVLAIAATMCDAVAEVLLQLTLQQ